MGFKKAYIGIAVVLVTTAVAFQNCGEGFNLDPGITERLSQAPNLRIVTGPAILTNSRNHIFAFEVDTNFSKEISTTMCALDGSDFEVCESPVELLDLTDGAHTFEIKAIDNYGYESSIEAPFTVDATLPLLTVNAAPAAVTGNADNQVAFTATDNLTLNDALVFECSFQGADFAPCVSPLAYVAQAENNYALLIRVKDAAGNNSEVIANNWQVDLTAPALSFVATPTAITNLDTATFQIAATDNNQALTNFECQLDNGGFAACTSPVNYAALADGNHSFQFRARDLANNLSAAATFNWMVDATAPTVTIVNGPDANTSETTADFVFSVTDLGSGVQLIECQLDDGGFAACASPVSFSGLATGVHKFQVRGTDVAGNQTVTDYDWAIEVIDGRVQGPLLHGANSVGIVGGNVIVLDTVRNQILRASTAFRTVLSGNGLAIGPDFARPYNIATNSTGTKAYVTNLGAGGILSTDLVSGERRLVSNAGVRGAGPSFNTPRDVAVTNDESTAYVADFIGLVRVDIATGDRSIISSSTIGAGPIISFPSAVYLDENNNQAFVADRSSVDALFRVDLSTGNRTLISSIARGSGPNFGAPFDLVMSPDYLTAYISDPNMDAIFKVDVATGNRTIISSPSVGVGPLLDSPRGIAINPTGTHAVVAHGYSILTVNLATGDREYFSDSRIGPGPAINNGILGKSSNPNQSFMLSGGSILLVNHSNGARTVVSNDQRGSGPSLVGSGDLAVESTGARAYVLKRMGADTLIIRVDLVTGNRTILSSAAVGVGPLPSQASSLVVDSNEAFAYVSDTIGAGSILRVDLVTGNRSIVASDAVGVGPLIRIRDMKLNSANTEAYVVTFQSELIKVDLSTGNRSIVSDRLTGIGEGLNGFKSLTLNSTDTFAYATSVFNNGLFNEDVVVKVDLITGDRTVLSGQLSALFATRVGTGEILHANCGDDIIVNASESKAFIGSCGLVEVDLVTGNRLFIAK